ncbi:hypothetical protein ACJ41O_006236 [Fusarium nematophilum]
MRNHFEFHPPRGVYLYKTWYTLTPPMGLDQALDEPTVNGLRCSDTLWAAAIIISATVASTPDLNSLPFLKPYGTSRSYQYLVVVIFGLILPTQFLQAIWIILVLEGLIAGAFKRTYSDWKSHILGSLVHPPLTAASLPPKLAAPCLLGGFIGSQYEGILAMLESGQKITLAHSVPAMRNKE